MFLTLTEYNLLDACNCQGSWGKGIAKGFREKVSVLQTLMKFPSVAKADYPRSILPRTKYIVLTARVTPKSKAEGF